MQRTSLTLDEIVSIEEIGEHESIDIEVSGNHLFFANNILTHNSSYQSDHKSIGMHSISDSMGVAFTADVILSIYSNEDLKSDGKVIMAQLKNRFGDPEKFKRFAVGQDASRMKFYDIDEDDEGRRLGAEELSEKVREGFEAQQLFMANSGGFDFD